MGFKDEVKELSKVVLSFQDCEEREYITDDEAIAAINVLNFSKYNKVPDVFLGCAAYNLLNVYVKQKTRGLSCMTMGEKDLREYIEKEIALYYEDGYTVMEVRFVKRKGLQPAKDEPDFHLKNYIRNKLYSCQDRPVILSAIFRKTWEKHVTFTSVKPFIPNTRVITICDHINLFRKDVEKVISIDSLNPGERYYIIGYCKPYKYADRMGVQLAINDGFCPIFGILEYDKMPAEMESKCHRFSIEEYLSAQQKELKL